MAEGAVTRPSESMYVRELKHPSERCSNSTEHVEQISLLQLLPLLVLLLLN
jgi:hypothetical protein